MRVLALSALVLVGCAGELENPERFASCPPGYVEQLFAAKCAGPCHAGAEPESGLDLESAGVEARLIGEPSVSGFCDGRLLIDPEADDPLDHLMLDKLQDRPTCGSRMPFGTEALTSAEVECVRRWIDDALGVEESP